MTKEDEARLAEIERDKDTLGVSDDDVDFLFHLIDEQAARIAKLEAREAKLIEAGDWYADQHPCCSGEWVERLEALDAEFPDPVAPGEVKP